MGIIHLRIFLGFELGSIPGKIENIVCQGVPEIGDFSVTLTDFNSTFDRL